MNMPDKQTLFFSITALSILSSSYAIDLHQAVAQNNASYEHYSKNGISISYPINWKVEQNISKYIIVRFTAATQSSNLSPAAVGIYRMQLQKTNSSTMNIDDTTLFKIFSFALLTYLNKTLDNMSIKETNLLSSPAYQVDSHNNGVTVGWLWTVKNSYAYIVIYAANTQYSNYYLPVVQSMINSFMLSASEPVQTISTNHNIYAQEHKNHAASQTNENNCLVNPHLLC